MTSLELRTVFFLSNGMSVLMALPPEGFDESLKAIAAAIQRDGETVCAVEIDSEWMDRGPEGERSLITFDDLPFTRDDLEQGLWTVVLEDRTAGGESGADR